MVTTKSSTVDGRDLIAPIYIKRKMEALSHMTLALGALGCDRTNRLFLSPLKTEGQIADHSQRAIDFLKAGAETQ